MRRGNNGGNEIHGGEPEQVETNTNIGDGKENSSHDEDDQPEGTSPTDNFFIKEYKKMMEEGTNLRRVEPINHDENQEEPPKPSHDDEEEGRSNQGAKLSGRLHHPRGR